VKIDVLGCWNKAGSFGFSKSIAGINVRSFNLVHGMSVPDNVVNACHTVALNEKGQEVEPTRMEPDPIQPERLVDVRLLGTDMSGWAASRVTERLKNMTSPSTPYGEWRPLARRPFQSCQ
jgi:hypothetical protein